MSTVNAIKLSDLRASMHDDYENGIPTSKRTNELRRLIKKQWADNRGLKEAPSRYNWTRLINPSSNFEICTRLPRDDHVSAWRAAGEAPRMITVWVSQPYGLTYSNIQDMATYAHHYNLEFFIDTHPAWHNPGAVLFVEWWRKGEHGRRTENRGAK